jgi:hypothetical protein
VRAGEFHPEAKTELVDIVAFYDWQNMQTQ